MTSLTDHHNQRREAMGLLARADARRLAALWKQAGLPSEARDLRRAESGLVTLRGRIGGGGSPFNLGEATMTRASVVMPDGRVGHAYALGRDGAKTRLAAICDALWQDETHRPQVEAGILQPLREAEQSADEKRREETAATKVDFFTMVRGED